ncbi:MAG: sensor histidine kinase, partial [Catenulispora sp.]|nr:sensor histidine kinase [Catenulispora sp.]
MKRALAVLTVAAYLTLVVDVAGGGRPWLSLLPGTAFLLVATLGFAWVQRRPDPGRRAVRWPRWAYVAVLYALGGAVFGASGASVGATLLLVVLV